MPTPNPGDEMVTQRDLRALRRDLHNKETELQDVRTIMQHHSDDHQEIIVRQNVELEMYKEEMKTFEAQDYLAHIQMPEFKLEVRTI